MTEAERLTLDFELSLHTPETHMRVLWTLIKIILGLAIAIPLGLVALGLTLGLAGTVVVLAILAVKLACVGLVGYGLYRIVRLAFAPAKTPPTPVRELPPRDAYYEAAMRELDSELGHPVR
jgi:hypothetical protein